MRDVPDPPLSFHPATVGRKQYAIFLINRTRLIWPDADDIAIPENTLNQYTTTAGVTPTDDANGNLTNDGTNSFADDTEHPPAHRCHQR